MSEAAPSAPAPASPANLRPQVEAFLAPMLDLMGYPAKLDFKDMPDGALGVALHLDPELPGLTPGKRSYLVDCMQFLVNKVINRPNVPRRWVNLAVNQFPEPRQAGQQQPQQSQPQPQPPRAAEAKPSAPSNGTLPAAPQKQGKPQKGQPAPAASAPPAVARAKQPERPQRSNPNDERSLTVTPDPVWTALGQSLAEKSVKHGRVYALMLVSPENRARLLEATKGLKGLTVKTEGEGHFRRVAFVPEKIAAISRKPVMPDYDEEDE